MPGWRPRSGPRSTDQRLPFAEPTPPEILGGRCRRRTWRSSGRSGRAGLLRGVMCACLIPRSRTRTEPCPTMRRRRSWGFQRRDSHCDCARGARRRGGLYYNQRWWRPRQAAAGVPRDGLKVWDLTAPLATLAVLLLVFVLVQTYGSWAAAGRAESDEATATLLLFREVDLVRDARLRTKFRKEVVCYATSVIRQDWPAMGNRRISSVPTYWGAHPRGRCVSCARLVARLRASRSSSATASGRAGGKSGSARHVRRCRTLSRG